MDNNANIELLRGHMDTIILCTLMPGDKYGLEILKEIVDSSQELYTLKQPTLYSALKRLTADGFITSYEGEVSNGRKRVYYSLTEKGRKFVTDDQLQWEFSRTIIDKLISDKVFDPVLNEKPFDPSEFRPSTKRSKVKLEECVAEPLKNEATVDNQSTPASNNENFLSQKNSDQSDLPCGVTSGAFTTSSYIASDIITPTAGNEPIKVANTDKVDDKFYFSSEVPMELKKQELKNRQGYHDTPASIDSLFDAKWEKPTINAVKEVHRIVPKEEFAFSSAVIVNKNEIDDIDRKTAASMLYSSEFATESKNAKSELPESLTHYDLNIQPRAKQNVITDKYSTVDTQKTNAVPLYNNTSKLVSKNYQDDSTSTLPTHISTDEKSVNYISTLGNIFNSSKSLPKIPPQPNEVKKDLYTYDQSVKVPTQTQPKLQTNTPVYMEDMNFAKLKSKLYEEDIILKQYVKSETSNYYVNKYYYNNKILRDWSYIAYAIFALFCIISYVSTIKIDGSNLGAFLGIMFSGAILPIFTTIKWSLNKSARKSANFSFAHAIVTGVIVALIFLMAILAISFFAIKINVSDIKTMVNPLILPLISLLMIPMNISIFSILYNSKKYHLR